MMRLRRQLAARGHDMEVWALYRKSGTFDEEPGTRVILPVSSPGILGYLTIVARLFWQLRAKRPDAVIAFMPLACALGQVVARLAGVPMRIASQRGPPEFYSPSMRLADRIAGSTGCYTANVAVSRSVIGSFVHYPSSYRRLLTPVHNGIEWTASTLSKGDARAKFGLDPDGVLALAVGRFHEQKNYPFLFQVFAQIPQAQLVIAGDGPLREELEQLADSLRLRPRLRLLGMVPKAEVNDLLRVADLFVQPSLYEGQSNALLEAMHEGLAIVASDVPAQVETLRGEDGIDAGLLLPVTDPERWATSIQALIDQPERRRDLGQRALARVQRFTPQRMADGFERLLLPSPYDGGAPRLDPP